MPHPTTKRLVSIDFIRILAMLMICTGHAAGGTGIWAAFDSIPNKALAMAVNMPMHIGVNLFVLISGYCGVLQSTKSVRYFKLWLQAVFFTLIFLPFAIHDGFYPNSNVIIAELFPIPLAGGYWFFTAYTGLFLLMPYLNILVRQLSKTQQYTLITGLFFLFCLLNKNCVTEIAGNGYNVIWMCALYLMGAIFRLNPPTWSNISLIIAGCIGYAGSYLMVTLPIIFRDTNFPFSLISSGYTSPFLTIQAISVFLLIVRLDMQDWRIRKPVFFLAPLMFGVYLAHMDGYIFIKHLSPLIRSLFIHNGHSQWWVIPFAGLLIFSISCVAAYIQVIIFKLCKVDKLASWIASKWDNLADKVRHAVFHA